MEIFDRTCRGNDAGKVVEMVGEACLTVGDIAKRLRRSTRYVRRLVDDCKELEFTAWPRLVREWVVRRKVNL